jgi:predicted N-acetyltransferase YhbS
MKIREETEKDINKITKIHNQAFNGRDEGKIVKKLRSNRNLIISLVCELQGKLGGHIAYIPGSLDQPEWKFLYFIKR